MICFDCAARHRSYGTHISFIRSINLDKWNRKQLKSIELSGNKYAKEKFQELGVNKVSGIYEYSSDLVQKYKSELAEIVKGQLNPSEVINVNVQSNANPDPNGMTASSSNKIKKIEDVNFDDIPVPENTSNGSNSTNPSKEPEYKEPTKFKNFAENVEVKVIGGSESGNTKSKRGNAKKIQKVDFDFNFDNFNDVNFSSFNSISENDNKNEESSSTNSKKKNQKQFDDEEDDLDNYKQVSKISKEEINKKFANKKAISSEDYANLNEDPSQTNSMKSRLNTMKSSQAISSSDLYGEPEEDGKKIKANL